MKSIIQLLRVHQYLKNIFIFAPLFFAGKLMDLYLLMNSVVAFIAFSLIASSVYIYNDINDVESDRNHPKKKFRPIASGSTSPTKAKYIQWLLLISGFLVSLLFLSYEVSIVMAMYVAINVLYSKVLKKFALYDISIIATGFVMRLFVGSCATGIELSHWIVIITFFLALFLASSKRRAECSAGRENVLSARKSMDGYSIELIDIILGITATISIVAYIMYSVMGSNEGTNLYLTTMFVLLGFLRFTQILLIEDKGEEPTKVVAKDKQMHIIALLWIISFGVFIYA